MIMGKSKRRAIVEALLLVCALTFMCTACGSKKPAAEIGADAETAENVTQTEDATEAQTADEGENGGESSAESRPELPDGVYTADFTTDSSMFHVSEACGGKGTLTVEDGKMTIHISLSSKNIVHLYLGLAADAQKEGAEILEPTVDTVTYSDGFTEEVNGFDVPVPALEQEFDLALLGKKGKWYDHKVIVSNPVEQDGAAENAGDGASASAEATLPENGVYTVEITFEGGSGKAKILSPVTVTIKDKTATASLQWDSPNYDYMIVDGQKYLPVNAEGDSVFEVPVTAFDEPLDVIGDTVAMSKPYEVEYTITFHSDTVKAVK